MTKLKVITMAQTNRRIRGLTCACWWPSKTTGLSQPDWEGILGELDALFEAAKDRLAFYGTSTHQEIDELATLYTYAQAQFDKSH